MNRCFIVADDFTGANDTGVQLTRRGFRTKVVLKPEGVADDGLSYVLDTESRNIPGEESREKVARLPLRRGMSVRTVLVYAGELSPVVPDSDFFDFIIPAQRLFGVD